MTDIDTRSLPPTLQDAVLRAELARLEAEQAAADERISELDRRALDDEVLREQRSHERATAAVLGMADRQVTEARSRIAKHAQRAADPALSAQERAAEESLALAAFRAQRDWAEVRTARAVVAEPPVYSRHGAHSWFRDVAAVAANPLDTRSDAFDRLERYGRGLARGLDGDSLRARKIWREATRKAEGAEAASAREYRAMSSGSASGGAFVPPAYVVEDFASYRAKRPGFVANVVTPRPLPDHGLVVFVPKITGPANGGAQSSENNAPGEVDPTATYETAPVGTYFGYVDGSQQLHDRTGGEFDSVIYAQLVDELDSSIDAAVLAAVLAAAPSPIARTQTTPLSLAQFLSDLGQSFASLQTTAGTRLAPTAVTAPVELGEWLLAQTASNGDAWFKPSLGGQRDGTGRTGQSVSGVPLILDDNLPAASGNAQLLTASSAATCLYAGEPIFDVLQGSGLAGALTVTWRARKYAAPVTRYPAGAIAITGTGYPLAPTFA